MADVQLRFRADSSSARKEIQQLKSEIIDLRQHLGRTEQSADATGEEIQQLGQQSRQAAMVVDVLGDESQRASQQIRELGDTTSRAGRETQDMTRDFDRARGGAHTFTRSLGGLGTVLGSIGIAAAGYEAIQFGRNAARAAIQIDSATRALAVLTESTAEATRTIREIQDLADEPGLRFRQAVEGTVALRAIGTEAETTTRILRELANAAAFTGGEGEFERGLLGFRQLIQRGRLSQEELNQITESLGLASRAIAEEWGTVLAEDIQAELDRTGQTIDDFVERTLTAFERLERFPLDAPSVKLKNLSNSFFEFQAAVGDRFLPAIAAGAEGLTKFFDGLTEFISGTDAATESVENFTTAIVEADTAIGREDAIQNRIRFLQEYIKELQEVERNLGIFDRRGRAQVGGEIASEQAELGRLERIQAGDPEIIRELTDRIKALDEELARIQQRQTERNNYILSLDERRRESARRSSEAFLEARAAEEDAVVKQIELRESELQRATEAAEGIADAEREKIKASEDATAAAEAAASATRAQTDALIAHIEATRQTRENLQALAEGQEALNDFWRVASGQVEDYSESIQTTIPSIVNLTEAENALTAAIDANLQTLRSATGDPLSDYVDGLTLTSRSADAALGSLNEVSEAVKATGGDFRVAEEHLRDFDDAFRLSEATIPRVTSEMRQFAGQVPPATQEVIEFRRELETLNRTGQDIDLSSVAEALNIQADPLRGAQLGGRDFYTQYLRDNALNIGEELASQAIRTAGQLRRIEQERVENLEDLEREYSEQIIAINEKKRQRLAAVEQQIEEERVRRLASIQQAFEDAADAEVAARERAAERIQQIEARAAEQRERLRERLNERLIALEERRDDRIQQLNDGFIERELDRQQEILDITQRAAEARAAAEQRYADTVQAINNRLVEAVRDIQRGLREEIESLEAGFVQRQADRADEIVRITEDAVRQRAAANQTFVDTMQDIYNDLVTAWDDLEEGFLERQEDRAEERVRIEERAAQGRIDAYQEYTETVARISTDLVDTVRDIQDEITEVVEDAAAERIEIEQDAIEQRREANAEYVQTLEEIETNRERQVSEQQRRITEIQADAAAARLSADEQYADRFQNIQNDLVDRVVGIQRDLNDTLNDLRDEQLDAEQDRLESLVDLHADARQRIEDLERESGQTIEDLRTEYQRDQEDAYQRLQERLADADSDSQREDAIRDYNRRIQELTREFHRDVADLRRQEAREREAIARQTAAREVQIAEQAQAEKARIAQAEAAARAQAQEGIASAEEAAGVSFLEAQENYIPALSAHEQALLAHAEALSRIGAAEESDIASVNQRISEIIETSFTDAATAAMTLSEALAAVSTAEQQRLATLDTDTAGTLSGLNQQITDAEARTGLSFEDALVNYTPAVDLNTRALNRLNETLSDINIDEQTALSALAETGRADRATTTETQQALVSDAGVSLEEARANFVPALSSAAEATLTLNETMQALDTSFRDAIAEIQEAGLVDRQAVDDAIQAAIADALAQQRTLETQAGTTFADASLAFQPGLSDIAQAGVDRDTALSGIDQTETEGIDAVNAQSIADRLETDAAITETRDAYIKARDTELFKHNAAILQLNLAEAADIKAVRATLDKDLESIDEKLDAELAEIREAKIVFDTRINELITAINNEANQDVTALKADTAAMRVELEAIAAEARNNAWKERNTFYSQYRNYNRWRSGRCGRRCAAGRSCGRSGCGWIG